MKNLTDRALNFAEVRGATYADVRIVERRTQNISVDGELCWLTGHGDLPARPSTRRPNSTGSPPWRCRSPGPALASRPTTSS